MDKPVVDLERAGQAIRELGLSLDDAAVSRVLDQLGVLAQAAQLCEEATLEGPSHG